MNQDLRAFYEMVVATRAGLLDWLDSLPDGVLVQHDENFAFGSLAAILAHVATTYHGWVGEVGLGDPDERVTASSVHELRDAFQRVDTTVGRALEAFTDLDMPRTWLDPHSKESVRYTQRWLILHAITHEFHHKGQALALGRVLGYPHPGRPDTDLLPPATEKGKRTR